jgi:hypothetical protein
VYMRVRDGGETALIACISVVLMETPLSAVDDFPYFLSRHCDRILFILHIVYLAKSLFPRKSAWSLYVCVFSFFFQKASSYGFMAYSSE